ncbi:secretory carrier-associated membrane protein 1-like isoform X1 [Mytilus galloprovincialis]|uniref:secretory carrier-associated membrane protein 1-like isoform X1 n=1 Tax=Mytilus edulis TaxID=6550 RepID=UPI0039EE026F
MSDFDSNPFADPEAQANPFSDPSVRQATGGNVGTNQGTMDEYNPFEDGNKTRPAAGSMTEQPLLDGAGRGSVPPPQPATQPAIMQPSEEPPPYAASGAQKIDTSDLQKRQEELERKAEELSRKEREMRNMQYNDRQNNWPPLPGFCPVGPCFYQDFSVDIPLEFQRTVKFVYYLWWFYVLVLLLNVLASLAFFIVDGDGGVTFGLSIVWFVLFTPCSFLCWYRPVYKAFRSDSSFNFFVFFFIFFFQFLVCIIQALGISTISVGWINGLGVVGKKPAAGAIMLFIALFFSICAVLQLVLLLRVHRIYRSTGASFAKAQQEFSTGVMRNEHVQSAAANAAAGAAKGMASQYGSNNKY